MKRVAENYLESWKNALDRKPLILRGARQVGKTYIVKQFGRTFDSYVELNFEKFPDAKKIFDKDFNIDRILRDLAIFTKKEIIPGKTLLFFDEVQMAPNVITSLRYFYEDFLELHVIAAGSLIDFALENIGLPVGRVSFLYLYPLSFLEFLEATKGSAIVDALKEVDYSTQSDFLYHEQLIESVAEYIAIGGMPEAVKTWIETQDIQRCRNVHNQIIEAYRQDFNKYSRSYQLKYIEIVFNKIPQLLGTKIKYTNISNDYQARELSPCIELLEKAGIIHKIQLSKSQEPPLGATISLKHFKSIFLDIGLAQAVLGLDIGDWVLNPRLNLENKGNLAEAFVGQELLAYSDATRRSTLYYWQRETPGSSAEIDYIFQDDDELIPIEVKSGITGGLKSLIYYIKNISGSGRGVHFSQRVYHRGSLYSSLPLYNVSKLFRHESENKKYWKFEFRDKDPITSEPINSVIELINSTAALLKCDKRLNIKLNNRDPVVIEPFIQMIAFVNFLFDYSGKCRPKWHANELRSVGKILSRDMNQIVKNVMRLRKL